MILRVERQMYFTNTLEFPGHVKYVFGISDHKFQAKPINFAGRFVLTLFRSMDTGTNKWLSLPRVCKIKEKNIPGHTALCRVMNINNELWNLNRTEERGAKS